MLKTNKAGTNIQVTLVITKACYEAIESKRGTVQRGLAQTIKTSSDTGVVQLGNLLPDSPNFKNKTSGRIYSADGSCPTLNTCEGGDRVPLCLNPVVDGKQPSIENRVYSPEGTSTAVTTSFPTKYDVGLRIRKLTPRECFRLMGVSDDRSERLLEMFPDSTLYHLAGDSIVTTCLMAIFSQCFGIDWQGKAKEGKLI